VLIASATRWALMHEHRGAPEPGLAVLLTRLGPVDLVLVEGFKREPHAKIEVHRAANGKPALHPDDPTIVAIASDVTWPGLLSLHIDDIDAIADAVLAHAVPR